MDTILNLLPVTYAERAAFQAAAPGVRQIFLPIPTMATPFDPRSPEGATQATVILGNAPPRFLPDFPSLRWLQTWSAGVDPYLVPGVLPEGAMLTSAVGAYGPAVSEHLFACLLSLMKRLPAYRDQQRAHLWQDLGPVRTLRDTTVLLLGTGDLGSHFAALCKAMGAHTVGLNRHPDRPLDHFDEVRSITELDFWLPGAAVVVLTLPATAETYHILDKGRMALMKADAILLNGGRGPAVDNLALAECLRSGRLWGAALDVTEPEPLPADHPLWDCENLLLTPHTAGGFRLDLTVRRVCAIALDNLKRYLAGEPLRNRMN